jgi:hypothetical protein
MAMNILRGGFPMTVHDSNPQAVRQLVDAGGYDRKLAT